MIRKLLSISLWAATSSAFAGQWSGNVSGQARYFFEQGELGQEQAQVSIAADLEYVHSWDDTTFVFAPFMRLDSMDDERSHFDIREAYFNIYTDAAEWRIGVRKTFWGVAESQHLVDIINQTDLVESFDGEDKLGQPMVNVSIERDWGILDIYSLLGFRERTFPGREGRLGVGFPVSDEALYESESEQKHVDWAARYSHSIDDYDFGVSAFHGTSREPIFLLNRFEGNVNPYYPQITQWGFDGQATLGNWLWKLEAIYRSGYGDESYFASVGGLEYSFYSIADSDIDLGLIFEVQYDQRSDIALANDPLSRSITLNDRLVLGSRLAFNDTQSTELLALVMQEQQSGTGLFSVEFARRLGSAWKLSINANYFFNRANSLFETPMWAVQKDSYLEVDLAYYF